METRPDHSASLEHLLGGLQGVKLPTVVASDFNDTLHSYHPYSLEQRKELAESMYARHQALFDVGGFERANFLLKLMEFFYPSESVSAAYFENLELLVGARPRLQQPGKLVLGLGTGRCGSTSLAAAFRNLDNALATHENPPMIFWEPRREQFEFHMKRLDYLRQYFSVVFDASHWWLKVLERFFEQFPDGKAVGLHRDMESCVTSFLKVKGIEAGTVNHWASPDDPLWPLNVWDPTYPSYASPEQHAGNPMMVKGTQIQWYVDSYNRQLQELASKYPDRLMLIETNKMQAPESAVALSALIGEPITVPEERYNAQSMDSVEQQHAFLL